MSYLLMEYNIEQNTSVNNSMINENNFLGNLDPNYKINDKNDMREFCLTNITPFIKGYIGNYYYYLHVILLFLGCFIILFSTNIIFLLCVLLIIVCDGVALMGYHQCPLTILEQKYLNKNMTSVVKNSLHKLNVNYNCNHEYETQMELLINCCTLISIKVLGIIIMKMFNFKFNEKF
jgi:hypothetical protein